MSRREAIKWMIAAAGTISVLDPQSFGATTLPSRIGSDPNLLNPVVPWPRTLSKEQLRMLASLCDLIIPADDRSPAASAVGVPDFIDEWVSAPYDEQQNDRKVVLEGLDWLKAESIKRFNKPFDDLDGKQMAAIADDICDPGKVKAEWRSAAGFFGRVRWLTLGAFYTTPEGMKDIGYVGNTPMATFPGPPPEVLAKLGLA
ncbi:MAG: gluconate 2-dehydrogenase subunit 3 family protein [Planctomycetes bacterium]|nr:gluconate 2-dehydrogenase subunit 3 family protein [Planctomycetota bacterium]